MYRNFKINDKDILNFEELQNSFDLWKIYFQLDDFIRFAKVHCKPLVRLNDEGAAENNNRFNNKYWYAVLCNDLKVCATINEFFVGTENSFDELARAREFSAVNVIKEIREEAEKLHIKERFDHIFKNIETVKKNFSKHDALVLLAICELAQIDALTINDFSLPVKNTEEKNETGILTLPSEETVILSTSNKPYKYRYYSSDYLVAEEKIKTVKVRATGSNYKDVIIELYDDADCEENKQPIKTVRLKNKEFLYCNVAGGKVIEFLPTDTGSGKELRLIRENYEKAEIKVIQTDGTERILSGENVSCFSGSDCNVGFMTVEKGKLKYPFYKPAKKFDSVELRLSSISQTVVEVRVTDSGYFVLTEDGTVIDNESITHCRAVSLGR